MNGWETRKITAQLVALRDGAWPSRWYGGRVRLHQPPCKADWDCKCGRYTPEQMRERLARKRAYQRIQRRRASRSATRAP